MYDDWRGIQFKKCPCRGLHNQGQGSRYQHNGREEENITVSVCDLHESGQYDWDKAKLASRPQSSHHARSAHSPSDDGASLGLQPHGAVAQTQAQPQQWMEAEMWWKWNLGLRYVQHRLEFGDQQYSHLQQEEKMKRKQIKQYSQIGPSAQGEAKQSAHMPGITTLNQITIPQKGRAHHNHFSTNMYIAQQTYKHLTVWSTAPGNIVTHRDNKHKTLNSNLPTTPNALPRVPETISTLLMTSSRSAIPAPLSP